MNSISIAGIIIGVLGVVFGITMKVKNKRISDLEDEKREAKHEALHMKYQEEVARKDASISNAAIRLARKVVSEPKEMDKPDEDDSKGVELDEEEQAIAASLSSDPFAD